MSPQCPHCHSGETVPITTFTPICTGLGAIGGVAAATATFAVKNGTSPAVITKAPSYLVACTAAGAQGAVIGKQIGQEIDQKFFPRYECKRCRETFPPIFSLI